MNVLFNCNNTRLKRPAHASSVVGVRIPDQKNEWVRLGTDRVREEVGYNRDAPHLKKKAK